MRLKKILRDIFIPWELLVEKLYNIKHISKNNIFRYSVRKYLGHKIILSDGTILKKGDNYIELHLDNLLILKDFKDADVVKSSFLFWKKVRSGLKELSSLILQNEDLRKLKVLMGISMINKGIQRAGFEVVDLFYLEKVLVSFYEGILLAVFSSNDFKKIKRMSAKRILISVSKMNKLYGSGGTYDLSK